MTLQCSSLFLTLKAGKVSLLLFAEHMVNMLRFHSQFYKNNPCCTRMFNKGDKCVLCVFFFFTPPVCVCVLREGGDHVSVRMEGLCHHPLLLLHRHHPPRCGAGVSPGCKSPSLWIFPPKLHIISKIIHFQPFLKKKSFIIKSTFPYFTVPKVKHKVRYLDCRETLICPLKPGCEPLFPLLGF